MTPIRDEFLSEEDLDLRNMSSDELFAYWDQWLLEAQATNDMDRNTYSHGVFVQMPAMEPGAQRVAEAPFDYHAD